jgi:hypothetical protein
MKRLLPALCAAALALTATGATLAPAYAQSSFGFQFNSGTSNAPHRGFERRGNDGYYNGQRGYRSQRPGYRQYNGFWFPPAAFAFGAIIGGVIGSAIANGENDALPSRHVAWCEDHYRSYRVSDNTFQPYSGGRQVCVSPYWG